MPSTIDFGLIDAKEGDVVCISDNPYGRPENKHNALIMAQAEAAYLNGLLELQRRIREDYQAQLIENNPVQGEDEDDVDNTKWRAVEKLLKEGAGNLYYT